ncbi:MAG: hypothetical protein WC758_08800 [Candidatus Woesearchaeota archaeon]|jgi:hypothetical protein
MEKIPNINSKIENIRTPEECMRELMGFQFEYLERIDKGIIKKPNINNTKKEYPNQFLKILSEHTSIEGYLADEYIKRLKNVNDREKEDFDFTLGHFVGVITGQICELYLNDKENWKNKTMELLDSKLNELGPVVNDLDKINNKKENRCGLINFDFIKIGNPKNLEKLKTFGLDSNDNYINIHFKNLFEQKQKDPNSKAPSLSESLNLLAEKIVDEYPQTKAIIGRSWMMDSVIVEKLKFKVFDRHDNSVYTNGSFWGQFIDQNGNIKKDEMDKFLNTGEAKFYLAEGIMMVNDFLKEYLPEDKKKNGYVKLMDYTDEAKKFEKEINEIKLNIDKNFKNFSYDELIMIIRSNEIISNYLDTEEGKEFLRMFKYMKEIGVKSMDNLEYEDRDRIKNNFNSFLDKHKNESVEKEVFIGNK